MSITVQRSLPKRVLFRLHWLAGLSAGLVLGVVGFTGGLLGMEEPTLDALNPQFNVSAANRVALTPDRWIAAMRAANPDKSVRNVSWNGDDQAVRLRVAGKGERGSELAMDPYDATVLGSARGAAFFATVEQLHRTLAAGPVGKQIVGASTALLILMVVTGVYLRWPRRRHSVASWLKPNLQAKGRGFWWQLHAIAGTWLLVFYLSTALTGLWWSYDFYRSAVNAMAGVPTPARRAPPPSGDAKAAPVSVDGAWSAFRAAAPDASRATFAVTDKSDAPLEIRYQTADSAHERAWNTLKIDLASGQVISRELYADLPRGRRFVSALFPVHTGSFLGVPGRVLVAVASLLLPFFTVTGVWLWLLRRRNEASRAHRAGATPTTSAPPKGDAAPA